MIVERYVISVQASQGTSTQLATDSVVICVKSTQTVAALEPLVLHLYRKNKLLFSFFLFLQNRHAVIDKATTHKYMARSELSAKL